MLIAFNKPYNVLCQFTDSTEPARPTLAAYGFPANVYAAGRLDFDSEGMLLLSDDGARIAQISSPKFKWPKTYLVQVEGIPGVEQIKSLAKGIKLNDGMTLPGQARTLEQAPDWLWPRDPPIRQRKTVPDSFIELTIREGRNRQVRRMCAAVGLPCLRLIRISVGPHSLKGIMPGEWRQEIES